MASGPYGAVLQQIHRLFQHGSVGGLSEWQLLDRYLTRQDEAAFEALVARHGPMVLGVCRRVLDDAHDVEDAFQATFLVLVRRARSLGEHDAIGHWLYGVAYRVALRARSEAARRRSLEKQVVRLEGMSHDDEPGRHELAAILDDELVRLPSKYRAPVVLCFLEGLTHEEAARQLRWPIGTVKGRLARARELLRGRVARRGLLPSAGLLAGVLARDASAAVPETLLQTTVRAALWISTGRAAGGVVSAAVARLMEGGLSTMFLTKLKMAVAVLGTCGCLTLAAWALGPQSNGARTGPNEAREAPKTAGGGAVARDSAAVDAAKEQTLLAKLEQPVALSFQGARLQDVLKFIKEATQTQGDPGVPIYVDPEGLREAGAAIDSPVSINAKDAPLKASLEKMLRPLKLAATTRDGLLVISSRPEVGFIELQKLNDQLKRLTARSQEPVGLGGPEGLSPAAWLNRRQGRRSAYYSTLAAESDDEASPEDEAKTRAILDALRKRVPIPFANETPLEDVFKYIKEQTQGESLPDGIPIYVDPIGLQEAEKTMTSPVTLDIKGVALQESLRLMLKQLGLLYVVKDGLLSITNEGSENTPTPILRLAEKATLGQLSLGEMKDLVELFKVREEVMRYAEGPPVGPQASPPAAPAPAKAAAVQNNPVPIPADADDDARTKTILAALNKVVPLHFQATPLETAIKDIQKATVGPDLPEGIPIYLDPRGLSSSGQKAEGLVTLDLKGVKLKTSLRLMVGQVGLAYTVNEGLLIIAPNDSPEIMSGGMGMGGMGGGFR